MRRLWSGNPSTRVAVLVLANLVLSLVVSSKEPPSCQVQVGDQPPRPCGYIQHSDACCIEPLSTRPVASHQRHLAAGGDEPPHSNVTFSGAPGGDVLYLVSHDEACGPAHECWEVSVSPLGQLDSPQAHIAAPATAAAALPPDTVVRVSFLAGPKPYNVSLTTVTLPRAAADAQGHELSGSAHDCRLLRGSTPVLDITGQDATLRLVPPRAEGPGDGRSPADAPSIPWGPTSPPAPTAAPALPPVCVTLHSDQCRVDCLNFTVPSQCSLGNKYRKSVHCVDKPFDSVLVIRNVTRFQPSEMASNMVSPDDTTLLYHCARLVLGGCVLATPTVAVRFIPPSPPMDVALRAHWVVRQPTAVFIAVPLLLMVVFVVFIVHRVWGGPPGQAGPPGLGLLRKAGSVGFRDLDSILAPDADRADRTDRAELATQCVATAVEATSAPSSAIASGQSRRALLLYSRPDGAPLRPLLGAVRALARVLEASGNVQVVDMYDDPLVLEEGAVLRAASVLEDEDLAVVVVATGCLALRPAPHDLDPYNMFIANVALVLSHAPDLAARRVYTVSLDARFNPNFLLGIPVSAVYVLPYHLKDLVVAASGCTLDEVAHKQVQADELKLRRCLKEYTALMQNDSSAFAET